MPEKRLYVKVHGRVQGVCFRAYTEEKGRELGLKGYVRNCSDGTVETEAEGEEDRLRDFLEWCREGPGSARVAKVDVQWGESKNQFNNFNIR